MKLETPISQGKFTDQNFAVDKTMLGGIYAVTVQIMGEPLNSSLCPAAQILESLTAVAILPLRQQRR